MALLEGGACYKELAMNYFFFFTLIVCTIVVLLRRLASLTVINLPVLASRPTVKESPMAISPFASFGSKPKHSTSHYASVSFHQKKCAQG